MNKSKDTNQHRIPLLKIYCPFGQFCPQWKAGKKPDASDCMDYIEAEIRKICEEEMAHDAEHEFTD